MSASHPLSQHKRLQVLKRLNILDTSEEQIFQDSVMLAAELCGTPIALVSLADRDRDWFKARVGLDAAEVPNNDSLFLHTIEQAGTFVVEDAADDSRFSRSDLLAGGSNVRFYAGTAILAGQVPVGTLSVLDRIPRQLSTKTVRELEALAHHVSAVLELRLRTESSAAERCELQLAIEEATEKETLLRHSAERFENLFAKLPVSCMTLDTDGKVMEWNAMSETLYGYTAPEALFKKVIDLVVPQAKRPEARKNFARTIKNGGYYEPAEWLVQRKDKTPIWVLTTGFPLHNPDGQVVGVISTNVDITARKKAEALLLESNLLIEGQRLELEIANSRLETLAFTDGLTGLNNHRAFQDSFHRSFIVAKRYHQELSVILADVDKFKSFNDAFGHLQGDAVLKQVATIMQKSARDSDFVGRYGGEEFAVVLPNTDLPGAVEVAERIRLAIAEATWPNRPVTASFGVASMTLSSPDTAEIIRRADEALYESKANGRNCVTAKGEPKTALA